MKKFLFEFFGDFFNSPKVVSLSALLGKDGKVPIKDILAGKFKNIKVEELPIGFRLSTISPKTGTETIFKVGRDGRLLAKENIIGSGNSISAILHSNKVLYNGTIKNGKPCIEPTVSYINYKLPVFEDANGFTTKFKKTPLGFEITSRIPFNY